MSAMGYASLNDRAPRGWLLGVCACISLRARVWVWIPRTLFILLGLAHTLLALALYAIVWAALCQHGERTAFVPNIRDRFYRMDTRVADLEAATLDREAALRRAFRDLT